MLTIRPARNSRARRVVRLLKKLELVMPPTWLEHKWRIY